MLKGFFLIHTLLNMLKIASCIQRPIVSGHQSHEKWPHFRILHPFLVEALRRGHYKLLIGGHCQNFLMSWPKENTHMLRSQILGSFESIFLFNYLSALKSSFKHFFTFLYTLLIKLLQNTCIWY